MALTCSLGFHRPNPDEVWNKGWYFTRCERCGSDLVRTGSGKWHVPKGRKVVWKSKTPRGRKPGEAAQPETAQPETGQPEPGAPEAAQPEVARPEFAQPEAGAPHTPPPPS